ncbi:hypothetical protein CLOM_g13473 [Closterium sp. NIES-68]|nr:hypothetical protein CLOM_g13473 [Closterium sp. NIES-68]
MIRGVQLYTVRWIASTAVDAPIDIDKLCAAVPDDLAMVIRKHADIFPDDLPSGLPPERDHDHKIELESGAQPTVRTQWRLTQPELDELRRHLDYLLEKGFVRPSTSLFAAPILFTLKKDGSLRMCIDYRALNRQNVISCATCQRMKSSRLRPAGLLQPLEPPSRPWQQVTMDFVTGVPAGSSGNGVILVVVDRLTKMAHFAACKTTIIAEQTAKLFLTNIVRLHSIPSAIISDRNPRFTSNFWTKTWQQYGTRAHVRLHLSTAYHPQSDGQTERTNHTVEQLIRMHRPGPMGRRPSLDRVCVQQSPIGHDYLVPVLPQLRNRSDNPSIATDRKPGTKISAVRRKSPTVSAKSRR